jgi:circadian clock protein KaiB
MSHEPEATPRRLLLRLYVAGESPNSLRAIANLQAICSAYLDGNVLVEIVDILEEPLRLFTDGVLVTPTLVKASPPPTWKIVGDLNETGKVLLALGVTPNESGVRNPGSEAAQQHR